MNSEKKSLPTGFRDVLTKEANLQLNYAKKLIKSFNLWGYNLIEPPFVEYESTLLDKMDDDLSKKTFTFSDPLTKKNLSLRHDITSQLARIAKDRLSHFPKPLRLCYFGDVFRADNPKLSPDRQFKQAGVELIGSKDLYADIEVIILSLESLSKVGFKKSSLDLNIPCIIEKIFDDFNISEEQRYNFKNKIAKRDIKFFKDKNIELYKILMQIINTSGSLKNNLKKIQQLQLGKNAKECLKEFIFISSVLLKNFKQYNFSVDLLEHRGFEYYTGITFSVFCINSNKEICRGGRYYTPQGDNAVGSTFFLNQFFQFQKYPAKENKKVLIPYKNLLDNNIYKLRKKGWITIQNFDKKNDLQVAKLHNCKFIFEKNKIKKIDK